MPKPTPEDMHSEAEVRLRALFNHSLDAILLTNDEGRYLDANPAACQLFGYKHEEILQMHIWDLTRTEDTELALKQWRWFIAAGKYQGEYPMWRKDGVRLETDFNAVAHIVPGVHLSIFRDITEKKQMEAQFLRAQRMESIGALAGGIAHDLSNVLGPIIMAVDLLKLRLKDPADLDLLDLIETSGRHGADMIKQVLSFSRGMEGAHVPVCLMDLVREVVKIANDTLPESITVEADVPANTWQVLGDRTQLHQVLLNLCINARDAMPGGGRLRLSVRNQRSDDPTSSLDPSAPNGAYAVLEVADTGEGMTPDVMGKIFAPFFTTKEPTKGTGLGLSTAQAIIKSHHGFLTVKSEPGRGSTFKIVLPAETDPDDAPAVVAVDALPRGNHEMILIIDDEASVRSITGLTLEAFGYRVISAADGAEGVAKYGQYTGEIAAVLVDMMMPVMDGLATIRVLRKINPDVQIIAASGWSTQGMEDEVAAESVKHFMPKPYTAETMLQTLDQLLHPAPA